MPAEHGKPNPHTIRARLAACADPAERAALLAERDRLIESCHAVPWYLAHKFAAKNTLLRVDDLASAGNVGLVLAAELFDPTRGFAFNTYAYQSIQSHIVMASKNQARVIRVPPHIVGELSDADLDPVVRERVERVSNPLSLDWRDGDGKPIGWLAGPEPDGPEFDELESLREALSRLPVRCQRVLHRRFHEGKTLQQIANEDGISKERVRQLQERGLKLLRQRLNPGAPEPARRKRKAG